MRSNIVRLLAVLAMVFISASALAQQPVKAELRMSAGAWKLWLQVERAGLGLVVIKSTSRQSGDLNIVRFGRGLDSSSVL